MLKKNFFYFAYSTLDVSYNIEKTGKLINLFLNVIYLHEG